MPPAAGVRTEQEIKVAVRYCSHLVAIRYLCLWPGIMSTFSSRKAIHSPGKIVTCEYVNARVVSPFLKMGPHASTTSPVFSHYHDHVARKHRSEGAEESEEKIYFPCTATLLVFLLLIRMIIVSPRVCFVPACDQLNKT